VFVVLDEAAQTDAGLCGSLAFNPSGALRPKCGLSKTGARLTCR